MATPDVTTLSSGTERRKGRVEGNLLHCKDSGDACFTSTHIYCPKLRNMAYLTAKQTGKYGVSQKFVFSSKDVRDSITKKKKERRNTGK